MASTGQASSHMPQKIQRSSSIVKLCGILFAVGPGAFGGHDVDAMGRAGRGAEEAGHALHPALLVAVQPVHAAVDQRIGDLVPLLGRLDRLLAAEQVPERRGQALRRTAADTILPARPSSGSSTHAMFGSSGFMATCSPRTRSAARRSAARAVVGRGRDRPASRPARRPASTAQPHSGHDRRAAARPSASASRSPYSIHTATATRFTRPQGASPSRPSPSTGRSGTAANSSGRA